MSEEMRITDIQVHADNADFNVNIENSAEFLVAAHNASSDVHQTILEPIKQRMENLSNIVSELEDNIVLRSEIPDKLSDLDNDMNFMNEDSLANALQIRQIVNLTTVEDKIATAKTEVENSITQNVNTINNSISSIQTSLSNLSVPERITSLVVPGSRMITFTLPANNGVITAPEDGIFSFGGRGAATTGNFIGLKRSGTPQVGTNVNKTNWFSLEMHVSRGENVTIYHQTLSETVLCFIYLKGTEPPEEDEE